jgi:hypothetical protein
MSNNLLTEKLIIVAGYMGAMISGSKSGYSKSHPNNLPIFNANICTDEGKVWFGDIDLTVKKDDLCELAKSEQIKFYVLYEHDARFENEDKPLLSKAVATFFPDGTFQINKDLQKYVSKDLLNDHKHRV